MENGDFLGAGRSQVFAEQGFALLVEIAATRRHDLCDVPFCLHLRVDPIDRETRNLAIDDEREMGGRIRGAEVNDVTASQEAYGDSRGNRRLADAALTHDHNQSPSRAREIVDQLVEAGKVNRFERLPGCC